MRTLVSIWLIGLIATISLTVPATAQYFSSWSYWNSDYNYGWPANVNNPNFDPAAAAINALNNSFPRSSGYSEPIDFSLIDEMERGNYSAFNTHEAKCQARYVSYQAATDTFIGYDGMPRRCRL